MVNLNSHTGRRLWHQIRIYSCCVCHFTPVVSPQCLHLMRPWFLVQYLHPTTVPLCSPESIDASHAGTGGLEFTMQITSGGETFLDLLNCGTCVSPGTIKDGPVGSCLECTILVHVRTCACVPGRSVPGIPVLLNLSKGWAILFVHFFLSGVCDAIMHGSDSHGQPEPSHIGASTASNLCLCVLCSPFHTRSLSPVSSSHATMVSCNISTLRLSHYVLRSSVLRVGFCRNGQCSTHFLGRQHNYAGRYL